MDLTLEEIFDLEDEVLGNFAFSEDLEEDRGYSERAKNCTTGKPCGDTCISKDKECKEDGKDRRGEVEDFLVEAKKLVTEATSSEQAQLRGYNRQAWKRVAIELNLIELNFGNPDNVRFFEDEKGETIGAVLTKTRADGEVEIETIAWRPTGDKDKAMADGTRLLEMLTSESILNAVAESPEIREILKRAGFKEADGKSTLFERFPPSVRNDFKQLINFGKESLRDVFDEDAATKEVAKMDALFAEAGSLRKQIKKARGEEKKLLKERLKEVEAETGDVRKALDQRFENIRNFLKKGADPDKIKQTVDALQFDGLFTDTVAAYKEFASEFLAITQPRSLGGLKKIEKDRSGENRAYADSYTKAIGMRNFVVEPGQPFNIFDADKKTLFHEMGHFIEFDDRGLAKTAKDWVKSRATGEPMPLNKMKGFMMVLYPDSEIAYPDKFADNYVGKLYDNASTEVISMGVEHLAGGWRARHIFAKDPDHFYLTIGTILSGREKP